MPVQLEKPGRLHRHSFLNPSEASSTINLRVITWLRSRALAQGLAKAAEHMRAIMWFLSLSGGAAVRLLAAFRDCRGPNKEPASVQLVLEVSSVLQIARR